MIKRKRRQKGQAFIEYVILIVVIALAALFVLASFSDRLRDMVTGVTVTLGGKPSDDADKDSKDIIKELGREGIQ
jgi:Flp pilus assembly pilin Flp